MSGRRPTKKSESLEIRISHEEKIALMRKAHAEGRSASAVMREFIALYLADRSKETRSMFFSSYKLAASAGAVGIAILWSLMAPSPLEAKPDLRAAFAAFDRNGDKSISLEEFLTRPGDRFFVANEGHATAETTGPVMIPLSKNAQPMMSGSPPPANLERGEFAAQDRNRDGRVTYDEFEDRQLAIMHQGFVSMDRNGDGVLDRSEYESVALGFPGNAQSSGFEELDSNKDGLLSEDELFA